MGGARRPPLAALLALAGIVGACGGPEPAPVSPQPIAAPTVDAGPAVATASDAAVDAQVAPAPLEPPAYLDSIAILREAAPKDEKGIARLRGAFAKLRALADPRAADDLARWLETSPEPRWRTQAALALAELGDRRAAEHLAWRLGQDTLTLYANVPELRRDDGERVAAARYLADLVLLSPSDEALAKLAEKAVSGWLGGQPQPHANGMRVLGLVATPYALERLRKWGDPADPLPKMGAMPPLPMAFATAQSGLRYYGAASKRAGKVDEAAKVLHKQLHRRPKDADLTMNALVAGGSALLGMSARSLAIGAAHGMAETGDPRFHDDLLAFVQDPKENEQARFEACGALAIVATDTQLALLVPKVAPPSGPTAPTDVVRGCLLETLSRRRVGAAGVYLAHLVENPPNLETAHMVARVLGRNGVDPAVRPRLLSALQSPKSRVHASLALLLGGEEADVALVIKTLSAADPVVTEELQVTYNQTFGWVSESDVSDGVVARWVRNARATGTTWAPAILGRALHDVEYDNGPRSMTRTRLRQRLLAAAKGTDARAKSDALLVLDAMNERGALESLGVTPSSPAPPR